jgi:hypothetical protein
MPCYHVERVLAFRDCYPLDPPQSCLAGHHFHNACFFSRIFLRRSESSGLPWTILLLCILPSAFLRFAFFSDSLGHFVRSTDKDMDLLSLYISFSVYKKKISLFARYSARSTQRPQQSLYMQSISGRRKCTPPSAHSPRF